MLWRYEARRSITETKKIDEQNYAFVQILRAGTGMLEGIINMMPNAKIGHIGMYRDEETFKPNVYFFKVPKNIENKEVIILDPMLATGGSGLDAITLLKEKGVKNIKFLCIIAAPEGIKRIEEDEDLANQKEEESSQIYDAILLTEQDWRI